MPTAPMTRADAEDSVARVQRFVDAGYRLGGAYPSAVAAAAKEAVAQGLVKTESAFESRYFRCRQRFNLFAIEPPAAPLGPAAPVDTPESRREAKDADYWRRRAKGLERDLAEAEHLAETLAGIRGAPIEIPDWIINPSDRKHRSVVGLLLSDVHAGEIVSADELLGLNGYSIDICRERLRRLFSAACTIPQRWISDCDNQGFFLALGGDLVSGDIHAELMETNEIVSQEQMFFVAAEITAGIRHLLETYGRVHVASVPGNHGRTTAKPQAKLAGRLSIDTAVAKIVQDRFDGDKRVTFQIGPSVDAVVPVLGHTILLTHGDRMGTGGGAGFAGPMLPIVRGTKKIEAQQSRAGRRPDLILHGHYHTSGNPGPVLSNGSVVGYGEFAAGLRASLEPPQQWLFLMHAKWGLRERVEVRLEDPAEPELPRVRVPANMARAT